MVQGNSSGSLHQARIDTWKSIARYLGRSPRTVQRWHREYGLPVHHLGSATGSIFAYPDELDSWLRDRDHSSEKMLLEMPRPALPRSPYLQPEFHEYRRTLELPLIPGSRKANSGALVASARKVWESLSNENLKLIAKYFREAVDLDPGNAEAFAGLSQTLIAGGLMGNIRVPDAYNSAKAALERAMEIDAELPEVKCAEAWLKMVLERDWNGARRRFDEHLNQRPTDTRAIVGRALIHVAEGCPSEAASLLRDAKQRRALNAFISALHCWSEYLAEDYGVALSLAEEARASGQSGPVLYAVEALVSIRCEKPDAYIPRIESLMADSPRNELLRGLLGYAFALNDQPKRANEILKAMTHSTAGERFGAPYPIALILTGLNERHDAAQWLEQSYRNGWLWSLGFPSDPALRSLRDEPSYRAFLSKACYPVPARRSEMHAGSPATLAEPLEA
jgi:hypothetical protein